MIPSPVDNVPAPIKSFLLAVGRIYIYNTAPFNFMKSSNSHFSHTICISSRKLESESEESGIVK